ncbi:MAG: hypothetical protein M1828_005541 [Chrysothrix sp. TS-e1954]|nr:MAG: hypothetical protein M1828_005541 [Chrysothrix sp. TS-e1954]
MPNGPEKRLDEILVTRAGPGDQRLERKDTNDAATGASAAGIRAVTAQLITFYFRAPIKAFFRTRFDYTAFARAINPSIREGQGWSWRTSSPVVLAQAIKEHGWQFLPNQVLPPMLANVAVGAVLYTTYLQTLARLHEPSSHASKRIYPPPSFEATMLAGFTAGSVQSVVAAPLDALSVRFKTNDMIEGRFKSMTGYARYKLHEIGLRGVFAGWSLSFLRDATGNALFFATFETVKSQAYYAFVKRWYANYKPALTRRPSNHFMHWSESLERPVIRPHYAIEPTFLLLAGVAASITQQIVQHPLGLIQNMHYERLESLDYAAKLEKPRAHMFSLYYAAYEKTLKQCARQVQARGGWRRLLYGNFLGSTVRQVPSTSAGLIVFELVRRRYAADDDAVCIQKDGYDILLS